MNKKNLLVKHHLVHVVFAIALIGCMYKTYTLIDRMTSNKAPLIFTKMTMPAYGEEIFKIDLTKVISVPIQTLIEPLNLLKQTMPYSKLVEKGVYQDDLMGHFRIPEEQELITLEKDNVYVPELPTPIKKQVNIEKLNDPSYLLGNIYTGDRDDLTIDEDLFKEWDFKDLASKEFRLDETIEGPKVLIFHTHAKERFADEKPGDPGILAVGDALEQLLEDKYGIETLHVTDHFYMNDTSENTDGCYERMEKVIQTVLDENPSIQVCIDLHRDGVDGQGKVIGDLNGEDAAKIMFVNGLTRQKNQAGENIPMKSLVNPYLDDNMAFALQAQIEGMKYYPELMRKVYLKAYRYSLHMKPMSLLIEIGAQNETSEEALRTAQPIAHILANVLEKD